MVRISIISNNVDGLKESNNAEAPDKLFSPLPDIYVEFTQEDARPVESDYDRIKGISQPLINIDTLNRNDYSFVKSESLNPAQSSQNVVIRLYAKKVVSKNIDKIDSGRIPISHTSSGGIAFAAQWALSRLHTGLGYSKGATWIKVTFPDYSILFINMHLPVKTSTKANGTLKNSTLGYDYRKKMFYKILEECKPMIDEKTNVIVGGDLNFRMTSDVTDQLTELLKERDAPLRLREFPFQDGNEATFTCKFKERSAEGCRLKSIRNAYNNMGNSKGCHDDARQPSRCDRFLINGMAKVSTYGTTILVPSSDHNTIYATLDIKGPPIMKGWTEETALQREGTQGGGKKKGKNRRAHRTRRRA
jgi:hypothetical protein